MYIEKYRDFLQNVFKETSQIKRDSLIALCPVNGIKSLQRQVSLTMYVLLSSQGIFEKQKPRKVCLSEGKNC